MMNEDESSGGGQGHTLRHTQGGMMAVPRPATAEELALDRIEADGRSNGYMDEARALLGDGLDTTNTINTTSSATNGATNPSIHQHQHHHSRGAGSAAGAGVAEQRRRGGSRHQDGGGAPGDEGSLTQSMSLYMKNTRRFFNSYWSKLAKQQRERTRKMAAANAKRSEDRDEGGVGEVGGDGGGVATDPTFFRSRSLTLLERERQSPWENGTQPSALAPALSKELPAELEMRDIEAGAGSIDIEASDGRDLEGGDEASPLLPATEAGDGTQGGEGVVGRPLRRNDRVMMTTGDLTRLVTMDEEQQGAGEASAQEARDNDRINGSIGAKATYCLAVRPSRSVSLPVQQPEVSESRIDQWRREEWADRSFKVLGVEIGHLPESQQFLVCAGGVFSFLLVYGYMQEYLVVGIFQRELGLFLTLLQFFGYAACAAVQRKMRSPKERKIPLITYGGLGFLQACMQGLTNMSMMYLNYPAKVLFKSSRMVPIMCFGVVWQGRRYSRRDYMVVVLIVMGLATFMNAETRASETSETPFSLVGVGCISLALVIDAAIINIQEEIMNRYDSCQDELIMFSYLCGTVYLVIASLFTGDLQEGIMFLHQKGIKALMAVTLFASAGYLGVSCVAALTKRFGALHSAITTTARKALTLMLSFIVFPNKPFSVQHLIGAAVFVFGLVAKATGKRSTSGLQVGQLASASPGTTPYIRLRGRKRLPIGRDSFDSSSSPSNVPLLSTNTIDSTSGGTGTGSNGDGNVDRSHSASPEGAEGSTNVNVPGHSGGYPVRHRGYPKNPLNGTPSNDKTGAPDGGMAGGRGGRLTRVNGVKESPQRSPRRRMLSPPVSGLGPRIPV